MVALIVGCQPLPLGINPAWFKAQAKSAQSKLEARTQVLAEQGPKADELYDGHLSVLVKKQKCDE